MPGSAPWFQPDAAALNLFLFPSHSPVETVTSSQIIAGAVALITLVALSAGSVPVLRLNRAGIAIVGAAALLATGVLSMTQAAATIDPSTILLLLSMMMINAVLELAGFFNLAGRLVIERAGSPLVLLILVAVSSGALSMLFLNDTVVLMLTPLVCSIALRLRRNPLPYLIALATAANVGSTATITGNPQNILIGASSGIPYLAFLAHLGPVALVGLVIVVAVIRVLYPQEFGVRRFGMLDGEADLPHLAADRPPLAHSAVSAAVNMPVLRKSLLVIAAMLIAFLAGAPVPVAALLAACALLITRRIKAEKILNLVDWPLLAMFAGLFVVTGALEQTGVSERLFALVKGLAYSGVAPLTLVTTLLSNTISNVPAVLLFRPLIANFPNPPLAWLTLAAASTLAGNLTLIGSVANLIVAEQSLKMGVRLSFMEYLRAGALITVLTLAAAIGWLELAARLG